MIYLKGLGKPISYHAFEKKLREKDSEILDLFPNLKENEKGNEPPESTAFQMRLPDVEGLFV